MKTFSSIITLLLIMLLSFSLNAQNRKERKALYNSSFNYEITCLGVGNDGTKLVKIWGYAKKAEDAAYKAKRNAVAAAIFRGIPAGNGAAPTPAICSDSDCWDKNEAFFETFFEAGGKYLQFVNVTTDGAPGGKDRLKMKKGYKVAVSSSIDFNNLRKYLEKEGITKSLDSRF